MTNDISELIEKEEEVIQTLHDLRAAAVDVVTVVAAVGDAACEDNRNAEH